jgi:predicted DNA-binding transcriptional regulator YafY
LRIDRKSDDFRVFRFDNVVTIEIDSDFPTKRLVGLCYAEGDCLSTRIKDFDQTFDGRTSQTVQSKVKEVLRKFREIEDAFERPIFERSGEIWISANVRFSDLRNHRRFIRLIH